MFNLNTTILLVGFVAYSVFVGTTAYSYGSAMSDKKWNDAQNKTTEEKLDVLEVQNEIDNSAVDITTITRRLYNGTF